MISNILLPHLIWNTSLHYNFALYRLRKAASYQAAFLFSMLDRESPDQLNYPGRPSRLSTPGTLMLSSS